MDAYEELMRHSDVEAMVAVLGTGENFVLIPLDDKPLDEYESLTNEAHEKGYAYCGSLSFANGKATAECEPDPRAIATMALACIEFAQRIVPAIRESNNEFLECLGSLPDTRTN